MDMPDEFYNDLLYQLVQARGGGEQARRAAPEKRDEQLVTWSFQNLATEAKAQAAINLLIARDMDKSMTRLSSAIEEFNKDSGKLQTIYIWLTVIIAVATVVNVIVSIVHK